MQRFASVARALAIASGIPLVVVAAQFALATLPIARADALSLDALASAASLALFAIAAASLGSAPIAQRLGLGPGRLSRSRVALASLGILGLSHAAEGVLRWSGASSPGLARFDDALAGLAPGRIGFPLFALAIGSAFGEELFFRGFLQRGIEPALGRVAAIATASLAFGIAHGDLAHGAAATALGCYLGVVALASDGVRASIAVHAVNNAVALFETATELRIPEGRLATPLSIAAGLTLTCVALVALPRPHASLPLQSQSGSAD